MFGRLRQYTSMTPWVAGVLLAVLLILISGSGANGDALRRHWMPEPAPVAGQAIYVVEGTADGRATIVYRARDLLGHMVEQHRESVTLPWKEDVTFYGGELLAVNAEVTRGAGPIGCKLFVGSIATAPIVAQINQTAVACAFVPESVGTPAPAQPAPERPKRVGQPDT
jgi:hypothetical protein